MDFFLRELRLQIPYLANKVVIGVSKDEANL
jgi:hypothetical protein